MISDDNQILNENKEIMNSQKRIIKGLFVLIFIGIMSSCSSVKGYQKMYLNEPCMALEGQKLDYFEINFETYREGASGANGGKVGGGCGCN
tara:strand:+ start:1047 stop:1319 length:273 start_codon:yes stop_codon:yes gene_type:complete